MKPFSHSIINSTQSLLGRLTKVTTMGCMLALVFIMATSALAQTSGKARPLKMSGIVTSVDYGTGTMEVVGTATHLGKFVSYAYWVPDYSVPLVVYAEFTAANGDTLRAYFPVWVGASGDATITGGTGRFAGASGSYVATFSGASQEIFTVEGTISY